MPTAVITESSEKTMSSRRIWTITPAKRTGAPAGLVSPCSSPSSFVMDLVRRLGDQEQAAADQDQVAPGDRPVPRCVKSGVGQADDPGEQGEQRRCAMHMARLRPRRRAVALPSAGSLPARIEMKMTLSMPRTISSTVRVSRAIQLSGFVSQVHALQGSGCNSRHPAVGPQGDPRVGAANVLGPLVQRRP